MGRAKEELSQLKNIEKEINAKLELAQLYREKAERCVAVYSSTPKGAGNGDRVGGFALLAVEAEEELDKLQDSYYYLNQIIRKRIAAMPMYEHRIILELRYIAGKKWQEVADEIGFSLRQTTRKHGDALMEYEKIMDLQSCPFMSI